MFCVKPLIFPGDWNISMNYARAKLPHTMTKETLIDNLEKCVDFDFKHPEFIKFCFSIAVHTIDACGCQSSTQINCILATFYVSENIKLHLKMLKEKLIN